MAVQLYAALLQIPGVDVPVLTWQENLRDMWDSTGGMRYPLMFCLVVGVIVIIFKFISLTATGAKTRRVLKDVDGLLTQRRIREALELTRDTNTAAANVLYAGLERHEEGTDRVMKAIENQGLIEMSKLEKGLVILATLTKHRSAPRLPRHGVGHDHRLPVHRGGGGKSRRRSSRVVSRSPC